MNEPENRIYTITYCSRNRIQGSPAKVRLELQNILNAARRNNSKLQLTGALLYNAGNFAQVLEGPLKHIQRVFEAIQRDPRHSEVTVIRSEFGQERQFPDWSMAFAGSSSFEASPDTTDAFEAVFAGAANGGGQMLSLLQELMEDESDWLLMDTAASA